MVGAISSACLYPMETELSLDRLLRLGFKTFEIFVNCESELSHSYIHRLRSTLQSNAAEVFSVHLFTSGFEPFMFFSNYPRRFNDSLEQYRRYFAAAAELGAKVVVFHGDRKDGQLNIEEYCCRFDLLNSCALSQGVILAQENVSRCRSGRVVFIRRMKELLGSHVHFVCDIKQALRAFEDPFDMIAAMGKNLICCHISDNTPQQDCLLPGTGTFDFEYFINEAFNYNHRITLVTEVYCTNFSEYSELIDSRNFINTFVKNSTII